MSVFTISIYYFTADRECGVIISLLFLCQADSGAFAICDHVTPGSASRRGLWLSRGSRGLQRVCNVAGSAVAGMRAARAGSSLCWIIYFDFVVTKDILFLFDWDVRKPGTLLVYIIPLGTPLYPK